MDAHMRRLLTIVCEGEQLGATLDDAPGTTGLLFVTGGTQTRIGSHRLFERLAATLSAQGTPCFRYDRRGVGDSSGADPDWRGSAPDLAAAAAAFRRECPSLRHVAGIGLCDGATALALFGPAAGVETLILLNPWLVETEPGTLAPAAIRKHYQEQLRSAKGWRRILSGSISWTRALKGVLKIAAPSPCALAADVARAMNLHGLPAEVILARGDGTAIAAAHEIGKPAFARLLRSPPVMIETPSHTFARPGDFEALLAAVADSLKRI
jgi:exosortase A-associated hydrolase 1